MSNFKNYLKLRFKIVNSLISFLKRNKTKLSLKESERRKSIDLFDINELSKPILRNYKFIVPENNLYGHGNLIKNSFPLNNAGIEHGFIYGSLVQDFNIKSWTNSIITFSDYRKNFIEKCTSKKIICIGPYIHYAELLFDANRFNELKNKLKKTLLVFPQHSIDDINLEFNKEEFIKFIKLKSKNFDTVLVCLYYKDIQDNNYESYTNAGFNIVTAGHIYDLYFLDRLKTIISLSDLVISNAVGTHIGYSIYLEKPLQLFRQLVKFKSNLDNINIHQRNNDDNKSLEIIKNELFEKFPISEHEVISSEQYNLISELFGFKYVQSE